MRFQKDEEFISEIEIKPKTELEQVTKSCFIVFSSREDHIENVIDSIETVIKDKHDFTVKRLDKEIGSDESQYETILDLLKECSFGIVILDGLRPNVMFEYGLLKGLGKPVMVFKEKNARIDVRNFYLDKNEDEREDIENPKIDYDKHLSDIKDRNYKEYDKNNLRDFRQILDDDFVKHNQDIINELRMMMTPKGFISEERLMSEQLNVIANKLAKTAKELIDQDELEIDQTVKIIDDLANELGVEMPAEYYFGLGNICSNRQKYEKAIVYYDVLLERNSEDSVALANKGHAFFHLGRFSEALACIDKALEIDQQDAVAWNIRALIIFKLGKLDDAIKSHDKALELDPKEGDFWDNKGNTLSSSSMYKEAIECYDKAIELNPKMKPALFNKCISLYKIGRFDEELKCIDKALKMYPEDAKILDLKAKNLSRLSKIDDAFVYINKALEIEPEGSDFLGDKAIILHKLGRTDDALKCIDKALKINQKDATLWYQKGIIAEDFNEAIKYYDKALEINPDLVEALCNKGSSLSNIGKYDEALKIFDEVENKCEKYDTCEIISLSKGITLSHIGKSEEAIKHFDKALELKPEFADAYNGRGNANIRLKQYEKALEDYNKAIELNPDYTDAYFNRGNAYGGKEDFDRAIEDYNKAIELNPDYTDAYINRGLVYAEKEDFDRAIEDYNRAIELNPDYAAAYINRGNAYGGKEDFDRAIEDYNRAIELNPDYAAAYINRGLVYAEKEDFDRAIEDYNRAIELNPDYAVAYINRGNAYGRLNQSEKEKEDYKKVLELDPNYILAMSNLVESYILTKNYSSAHEIAGRASDIAEESEDVIISHFLMVCLSLLQNKKEDATSQLNRLINYLEKVKDWTLTWDFSDIAPAISRLDEDAKSLMLSLIELLENKITLNEFKNLLGDYT